MGSAQRWASCATTRPNPHGRSLHRTRRRPETNVGAAARMVAMGGRGPGRLGARAGCGVCLPRRGHGRRADPVALSRCRRPPRSRSARGIRSRRCCSCSGDGRESSDRADPSLLRPLLRCCSCSTPSRRAPISAARVRPALGIAVTSVVEVTADNGNIADLWVIAPVFAVPWLAGPAARASRRQADRLRLLTAGLDASATRACGSLSSRSTPD